MHIPSQRSTTFKLIALLAIITISIMAAASSNSPFKESDKAFYADSKTINFVRPGLSLRIVGADIATDGTMTAAVSISDPKGLPLDQAGVTTPGAVAINCTMAALPQNSNNFVSYTSFPVSGKGGNGIQVWYDGGGAWKQTADGQYTYTFKTKAPSGFDITASHRVGCSATRDLSEFDLGTNYSGATLDFTPGGKPATQVHDVVRTAACNSCHGTLAFHGGEAVGADLCVMCHTSGAIDPTTGNGLSLPVLIHKVHMGENLPSVKAGTPYQIAGYMGAISDFSTVAYPSDAGRCQTCHDAKYGAKQANNYLTPNRAACGACHDNVNFASGENHVNLPQVDDKQCSTCHQPQGELPLDASIKGAHINTAAVVPDEQDFVPGMVFDNLKVTNGTPGNKPTISFTMKEKNGAPIALTELTKSPGRIAAVLAGSAKDYGYTNFGSDVTTGGYVSEDVTKGGSCDTAGNCVYTFQHAIPANASGTFSIGLEGRRGLVILAGTQKQASTEYGAHNAVVNFSVDGSAVKARRQVVDLAKCNQCHTYLSLHGTNRDRVEQCVLCHNASETDAARRPAATNATDKATPPQAVEFAYMVHRIHTGEHLKTLFGAGYTVVGFGGSHNDFSEVRYPVMFGNGGTGNVGKCDMCHVNGSEQNLPEGLAAMKNPQSPINPTPQTTAVCTGCHAATATLSHATANTTTLGESCSTCHGKSAQFGVGKAHAQ